LGNICVIRAGRQLPFDRQALVKLLGNSEVPIRLNLNLGTAEATAWGCNLSEEYVTINSRYTT
jgi:glutamate N-acetyltransferase/amino-acid N-acetyltransferase